MKIAYLTSEWAYQAPWEDDGKPLPGGAGWYRCRIPADGLRANGHEVVVFGRVKQQPSGEVIPLGFANEEHESPDLIVIQRWMYEDAAKFINLARAYGHTVIQDVDDWFWGLDPANRAFVDGHPRPQMMTLGYNRSELRRRGRALPPKDRQAAFGAHEQERHRAHYARSLAASDAITTSTEYLAQRLRQMFPRVPVFVIRNAIDLERWKPIAAENGNRRPGRQPTLGCAHALEWRFGRPRAAARDHRPIRCRPRSPGNMGGGYSRDAGHVPSEDGTAHRSDIGSQHGTDK